MNEIRKIVDNKSITAISVDYESLVVKPFLKQVDFYRYVEAKLKLKGFTKSRIEAEKQARVKFEKPTT